MKKKNIFTFKKSQQWQDEFTLECRLLSKTLSNKEIEDFSTS